MGILNKEIKLQKEMEETKKEPSTFIWWFLFLVGVGVIVVCAIVFTD